MPEIQCLSIFPAILTLCKRAARTVLTGMCYSVGSATRRGAVRRPGLSASRL